MTPSMKPSESFDDWATRHATIFSLAGESEVAMLASWQPILESAGYSLAELDDATYWMASQQAPSFVRDHLPAIQNRIRQMRTMLTHEQLQAAQKDQWQLDHEWEPDVKKRWNAFMKKANTEHPPSKRKGLGKL